MGAVLDVRGAASSCVRVGPVLEYVLESVEQAC